MQEETTTTRTYQGTPLYAYIDASTRSKSAQEEYPEFFENDDHLDRIDKVTKVIEDFFNCKPSYITSRSNRGNPFDSVKVEAAGYKIARTPSKEKQEKLYGPLSAIGSVTYKVTNGHLIVRVY